MSTTTTYPAGSNRAQFDSNGSNRYGDGTSTAAQGANTVVHFYDRAGVKAANRVNLYGQFADRKSMPKKMGKTFKISKFMHMYDRALNDAEFAAKGFLSARDIDAVNTALNAASLAEGAGAVNKRTLQKVTMETSLARYGEMIDYTDEVELFSEDAIQVRYREELGELANSRMEDLIQLDMLSTGTVIYGGTALDIDELDDTSTVSYDLIRKAVRKLVRNRATKNTSLITGSTKIDTRTVDKAFYSIIGANVKGDLENLTRGSGNETEYVYVPSHKYGAAGSLAEGEVGAMHEVRFIESESAVVYSGQGSFVPDAYAGDLSWTADADATATITAAEAVSNFPTAIFTVTVTTADADISGVNGLTGNYGDTLVIGTHDILGADAELLDAVTNVAFDVEVGKGRFDAFPILFPAQGCFATVGLKGMGKIKFNSKAPSAVELNNPYGTNGFFSYNFFYAGIILEEEKLLKILVTATA